MKELNEKIKNQSSQIDNKIEERGSKALSKEKLICLVFIFFKLFWKISLNVS